jgi:hypothetical protein
MGANRANSPTLCIRHSFSGQAIYFGGQTRVILDAFQPDWMATSDPANVLTLRRGSQTAVKKSVFKVALPANDNMAPLPRD